MEGSRGVKGTKERGQLCKRIKEGVTRGAVKTMVSRCGKGNRQWVLGVVNERERGTKGMVSKIRVQRGGEGG